MIEHDGRLWTWALTRLPQAWHGRLADSNVTESAPQKRHDDANAPILAERLADHRIEYLDYEGPVSRDRGFVRCCCRGTCQIIEATTDRVVIRMELPLSGSLILEQRAIDNAHWSVVWDESETY